MTTRVGFDATPLLGQRSGVGHYTARLLAALLDVAPEWEHRFYSNRPLGPLEPELKRAVKIPAYLPASRWLWMQLLLPDVIRRDQPNLCHFTNAIAPLRHAAPYVLTVHDASLFLFRHFHPWSRLLAMRLIMPTIARRAAAIITVSETARQDLLRVLNLPPEKVEVVYEAPPDWFHRVEDAAALTTLQQKYNLPQAFILYVGTMEPRKNLSRLVQALALLRRQGCPVPMIMVGPMGWHMDGFPQLIDRLQLTDYVRYLGYVPTADLPGLFTLATLFAFPSLYEGFGLPPVEAMVCGTPILTSRNTAMAEICDDAAELVDPNDVEAIAGGLHKLLSDPDRRQALRQLGFQRAASFSWHTAAVKTLSIYQRILANGQSPA
jgi:glycosyltransferase involved in cell wall biosynthesis